MENCIRFFSSLAAAITAANTKLAQGFGWRGRVNKQNGVGKQSQKKKENAGESN